MSKLALQYLVAAYGPEKLNEPDKAEPIVQKMIQMDPNDPANYFALSKITRTPAATRRPSRRCSRPARSSRTTRWSTRTISGFYNRQGDFQKTMEALQKAADLEPKNPQGYQMVATYYWEKAYKDHRLTSRAEEGIHRRRASKRPTRRWRSTRTTPTR